MTAKRFKVINLRDYNICDIQDTSQEIPTFYNDLTYNFGSAKAICNLLNELHEENQALKKHIRELYRVVKIDVDNEIEVYPKVMLEYLINILKIIGDVE